MKFLITGGAGYIGSSIAHALSDDGHEVVIVDALLKASKQNISGLQLVHERIGAPGLLRRVAKQYGLFDFVIHCASLISVPESQRDPQEYLRNNVAEFIAFMQDISEIGCERLIYSSSASVYGAIDGEVSELSEIAPMSVYARTKWINEEIVSTLCSAARLRAISLRYFNPIGTETKRRCGPGNIKDGSLLNALCIAAISGGRFLLTGTDWPTRDGTGVRDYVDVVDLAKAHILACQNFDFIMSKMDGSSDQTRVINLGTGRGVTVREIVAAVERVVGRSLDIQMVERRPGDVAGSYANNNLARHLLGWHPTVSLEESIKKHIEWWRAKGLD